jgi:tol-pal system beta propeller repeat protein TolB
MNADGSNQQRLTSGRAHSHYGSISPDGSTIAFSSYRSGQWEIHLMDLDGSNPRQLTRNHGQNHAPSISPDGSRIVFTSTAGSPKNDQNIWVMDIDGSNLRQLTFDRGGHSLDPEWSPDGQLISFASERDGARRLYVMRADGSDVRLLTPHTEIGGRSDWSPDGRYIAFYAGGKYQTEIFVVPASGGEIRQVTYSVDNKGPSYSPDGEWIAYACRAAPSESNEICIIRVDGSEETQLTSDGRGNFQPRWGP